VLQLRSASEKYFTVDAWLVTRTLAAQVHLANIGRKSQCCFLSDVITGWYATTRVRAQIYGILEYRYRRFQAATFHSSPHPFLLACVPIDSALVLQLGNFITTSTYNNRRCVYRLTCYE
jgi:hypothetical protein